LLACVRARAQEKDELEAEVELTRQRGEQARSRPALEAVVRLCMSSVASITLCVSFLLLGYQLDAHDVRRERCSSPALHGC
jgi:hypothetical protein